MTDLEHFTLQILESKTDKALRKAGLKKQKWDDATTQFLRVKAGYSDTTWECN